MQSLFRLENDLSAGTCYLTQWPYAKQGLLNNISKIEDYYRTYSIAAASSHVLVRLIMTMNLPRGLGFERYVANAYSSSMNVAQALKMTTSSSKGKIWDGDFYGAGSKEILIGHSDYFNLWQLKENWKSYCPVTVLCHNQTNSRFLIPDGKTNSLEKGVAVIAINIPMLMAMYFCFNEEQDAAEAQGFPRKTPAQFVHGHALSGMIRSHADNVMLNQLYANSCGTPVMPALRNHSFFTPDYSSAVESVVEQQNIYVRNMDSRLLGTLKAVHVPCANTMREMVTLPKVAPTLQCFWALVISRLKVLAYVMGTQRNAAKTMMSEYQNISWMMKIEQTKNVMKNNLGLEAYYHVAPLLDRAKI